MSWIKMRRALKICKDYNLEITKMGLLWAGKKHGFVEKHSDGYHWIFNLNKLLQFVGYAIEEPPEGWIIIRKASKKYKINLLKLYRLIKRKEVECKQFGRQRMYYVRSDEMEEIKKGASKKYLCVDDVAKQYKVGIMRIYSMIAKNQLETTKFKGDPKLYVKKSDINKRFDKRDKENNNVKEK